MREKEEDRLFQGFGFGFHHSEGSVPHNNDLVGGLFPVLAVEGHHFCSDALINVISFCQKAKCSIRKTPRILGPMNV